MKLFKKLLKPLGLIVALLLITACQNQQEDSNTVKVGTISGPETQLMEVAKDVAKKQYGLNVQIVEFSDYSLPNAALNDGSLDANAFQHKPYLDSEIANRGYQLTIIGKTFVYPMAIYSNKIKKITDVPQNAIVAIPSDPSNEARALILLSKAGLITLKPGVTITATPVDVASNPKNIQFKELDAAQLPRVLPDVTLSVINTNYAIPAGLYPSKDAIYVEDKSSPYVNLIVARTNDANAQKLKELVQAFQSPEVLQKAKELFQGQAIVGW